ncbi:MAG: NAD(P)H-binding protein [Pseudomonadota bacterium]
MKLVVLGANGRTGQLIVETALARGMDVTAIVRSAQKSLPIDHDRLTIVVGDPCDPAFLKTVLRGQDALVSALGARRPTKAGTSVCPRSAAAIVEAALETGLSRVLVTSTALLFREQTLLGKILRVIVPNTVRSAARMEEILAASDLNWTSARPGFLTDAHEDAYRAQKDSLPKSGISVSRRALAHFLIDAIEAPDASYAAFGVSKAAA